MHFNIDLRNIVFIAAGTFWLMALLLALLIKSETPIKGPKEWSVGNVLSGIGLFLFGWDGVIPDLFSISVSNFFITIGLSYYLKGVWLFREKKVNYWIFWVLPVFSFVQSVIFTDFWHWFDIRRVLFSLTIMTGSLLLANETLIPAKKPLLIALRITAISSTFFASIMLIRAIATLLFPIPGNIVSTPVTVSVWLATAVAQIVNSFGFLFMFLYRQAEELKMKVSGMSRFYFILAHDLRGPIGTVKSMAEVVATSPGLGETEREVVAAIEKSSSNTYTLLENLLEWGRNITGELYPQEKEISLASLAQQVTELLEPMAKEKEIHFRSDLTTRATVLADEQMIHTVIRNILTNAIKFTAPGGHISVSTGESTWGCWLAIEDNGVGITDENLSKLTEPFPSLTTPGTNGEKGFGLGLSLCRYLVSRNKGYFQIESKEGSGTHVKVSFPRHS